MQDYNVSDYGILSNAIYTSTTTSPHTTIYEMK